MKTFDPVFTAALTSEVNRLSWCWRITRKDSIELGFTSFDLPLTIEGLTYKPDGGFSPSANKNTLNLDSADNQNLQAYFQDTAINSSDLIAGKYDYAQIDCFIVDVTNLPNSLSANPPKHKYQYGGILGKVISSDRGFEFEIRGLDDLLETKVGSVTSKLCRYDFGNNFCTVNLISFTHQQQITAVTNSKRIFTINGTQKDGYFDYGLTTFANGYKADIAYYADNQIVLFLPLPFEVEAGDNVTVVAGCPKTLLACQIFNNTINFGGEPHVPLADKFLYTPIENDD